MTDSGTPLPLAGSLQRPLRWLYLLSAIPLAVAIGVLAVLAARGGSTRPPALLLVVIPVSVLLAQWLLVRGIRRVGASVRCGDLILDTGLGKKRIALAHLRGRGLRVVNLAERTDLKPWLRTMGTSLPGLAAGWFRLRNGERALCLLTARDRVAYLRSDTDNVSLLLSLQNPDALRALLER